MFKFLKSSLVATDGKRYVAMNKPGSQLYSLTNKIEEAVNFKWCWVFASKKIWLTGIKKLFGKDFNFKWVDKNVIHI